MALEQSLPPAAAASSSTSSSSEQQQPEGGAQPQQNQPLIDIEWKPYMIDPSISVGGEDLEAYCMRRWGSSAWINRLKVEGGKSGAPFSNWKYACHTLKAHRLIKYAHDKHNVDTSTSNAAIFKALYEEGKNISSVDVLVEIGHHELQLPKTNELRKYLESHQDEQNVKDEMRNYSRQYSITGVPLFVIEGGDGTTPYGLSGAQPKEAFLQIFQELLEE
jgi:predicted DsbA family dithiol-disulfide isomerase